MSEAYYYILPENVMVLPIGCKARVINLNTNATVIRLTSTLVASASMTETCRVLCRVIYRVGWIIERGLSVPTATLGRRGVNRKKFLGLTTTCQTSGDKKKYKMRKWHAYDVVVRRVKGFQKTSRSPTTAQNHKCLFFSIER